MLPGGLSERHRARPERRNDTGPILRAGRVGEKCRDQSWRAGRTGVCRLSLQAPHRGDGGATCARGLGCPPFVWRSPGCVAVSYDAGRT